MAGFGAGFASAAILGCFCYFGSKNSCHIVTHKHAQPFYRSLDFVNW